MNEINEITKNTSTKVTSFVKDFKSFISKGNVIDMAVGVIIGGAFGKIVASLVSDIIMPPIGLLVGGVNFTELKFIIQKAVLDPVVPNKIITPEVAINYGKFIQTSFDFIIIAFAIFIMLKVVMAFKRKEEEKSSAPPEPSKTEILLTEIRDLLKKN